MRTAFLLAALVAGVVAVLLGYGHAPDYSADFGGWLALSLTLYVAASLPFDRFDRQ